LGVKKQAGRFARLAFFMPMPLLEPNLLAWRKKSYRFFTFAPMKRQSLIALALMLCAFRSFSGTGCLPVVLLPNVSSGVLQSPLSVCRYKKPFPFQCVQLMKKRLSNPPDGGQVSVFNDDMKPPAPSNEAPPFIPISPAQLRESKTALRFFLAVHWHSCGIERNVFHPPPFVG